MTRGEEGAIQVLYEVEGTSRAPATFDERQVRKARRVKTR